MAERISPEHSAASYISPRPTRESRRDAINACRGCDLYRRATQVVPGEGPARPRLMLVGKRRIHDKPNAREVEACRPWFQTELDLVKPEVVVALGATAAQAILGPAFRISRERGRFVTSPLDAKVLATAHPSAVLRMPDERARREAMAQLIADLRVVARALKTKASA